MIDFILSITPYKALFTTISLSILGSSLLVVVLQNSIHSVISLIASFFFASCFLLFFENEFFAFLFLTIYVGAIAVLFLFVIMMLNTKFIMLSKRDPKKYLIFGSLIGLNFLFLLHNSIDNFFPDYSCYTDPNFLSNYRVDYMTEDCLNEVEAIGQVLYTHFVFQFLISGLILLLAIIGVVSLTTNFNKKNLTRNIKSVSRKTDLKNDKN